MMEPDFSGKLPFGQNWAKRTKIAENGVLRYSSNLAH